MQIVAKYYLWTKAFHVIFVISWMAGMLYLPRLYVYHAETVLGSEIDEKFQIMERRLLRIIINPAMILSLLTGLILIAITKAGAPGTGLWMHIKLLFVVALLLNHMLLSYYRKRFVAGLNKKSANFFRFLNEAGTLCMIVIVIMVIVRPF
ncbi:membrane protein [Rickettsiales bacterium]|nr:membrane protein [Rickettsiales bacterium]